MLPRTSNFCARFLQYLQLAPGNPVDRVEKPVAILSSVCKAPAIWASSFQGQLACLPRGAQVLILKIGAFRFKIMFLSGLLLWVFRCHASHETAFPC